MAAEELKFENENEGFDPTSCPVSQEPFDEQENFPMLVVSSGHTISKATLDTWWVKHDTCPCCHIKTTKMASKNFKVLELVQILNGSLKNSQDLRAENQHLKSQCTAYRESLENTFSETGAAERLQVALQEANGNQRLLTEALQKADRRAAELQAQVSTAQEEPKRLHQGLKEQAKRFQTKRQENKKLKKEAIEKDAELESLRAALAASQADNKKLKEEGAADKEKIQTLSKKLSTTKSKLSQKTNEYSAQTKELNTIRKNFNELRASAEQAPKTGFSASSSTSSKLPDVIQSPSPALAESKAVEAQPVQSISVPVAKTKPSSATQAPKAGFSASNSTSSKLSDVIQPPSPVLAESKAVEAQPAQSISVPVTKTKPSSPPAASANPQQTPHPKKQMPQNTTAGVKKSAVAKGDVKSQFNDPDLTMLQKLVDENKADEAITLGDKMEADRNERIVLIRKHLLERALVENDQAIFDNYVESILKLADRSQKRVKHIVEIAQRHTKEICVENNLPADRTSNYVRALKEHYIVIILISQDDQALHVFLDEGIVSWFNPMENNHNTTQGLKNFGQFIIDLTKNLRSQGKLKQEYVPQAISLVVKTYCQKGKYYENINPQFATALYQCAASYGSRQGRYDLARCYAEGIGVKENRVKAIATLEQIQDFQKIPEAKILLEKLKAAQPPAATLSVLPPSNASPAEDPNNESKGENETQQLVDTLTTTLEQNAVKNDLSEIQSLLKAISAAELTNLCNWLAPQLQEEKDQVAETETNKALYALALYEQGERYEEGRGIPVPQNGQTNDEIAVHYFSQIENYPFGQYKLGMHYLKGAGVKKDEARGAAYLKKSADAELSGAQYEFGMCCLDGRGVDRNIEQAITLFKLAAKKNHPLARCMLACVYLDNMGINTTFTLAKNALLGATERKGLANGLYYLALSCSQQPFTGNDFWEKKDKVTNELRSALLYKLAYIYGHPNTKQSLQIFYNQGIGIDPGLKSTRLKQDPVGVENHRNTMRDQLGLIERETAKVTQDAFNQIDGMRQHDTLLKEQAQHATQRLEVEHPQLFPAAPGRHGVLARNNPAVASPAQLQAGAGSSFNPPC